MISTALYLPWCTYVPLRKHAHDHCLIVCNRMYMEDLKAKYGNLVPERESSSCLTLTHSVNLPFKEL